MRFLTEFFNSGTVNQQNKRRLGALVIAVTAALLAVALIVLMVASIVTAVKNNRVADDESEGDGEGGIPSGYTTTTLADGQASNGALLLIDAAHPYVGTETLVQPAPGVRPVDENNQMLYKGDYQDVNITQETLDAFHAMVQDFHEAQKADESYKVGGFWLQSLLRPGVELSADTAAVVGSGYALIFFDQYLDRSIYDSEAKTGVGVYKWIYENAHKYGFIRVSNAEGEENIFRYVGVAHATYIVNNKTTFAAYLETLKTKTSVSKSISIPVTDAKNQKVTYRVYYLASDAEITVPEKYSYTVSGDNMGGYIVTVDQSSAKK